MVIACSIVVKVDKIVSNCLCALGVLENKPSLSKNKPYVCINPLLEIKVPIVRLILVILLLVPVNEKSFHSNNQAIPKLKIITK